MIGAFSKRNALSRAMQAQQQSFSAQRQQLLKALGASPQVQQLQGLMNNSPGQQLARLINQQAALNGTWGGGGTTASTWDDDLDSGGTWITASSGGTGSITSNANTVTTTNNYYVSGPTAYVNYTPPPRPAGPPVPPPPMSIWRDADVQDGHATKIKLPDGTVIDVAKDGNYTINDKDAKIVYRANRLREFNSFLNASDKLEGFIKFCGEQGIRRDDMLNLPINLFIGWLVLEAAKADQEPEPPVPLLADLRKVKVPRCGGCGQFLKRDLAARKITYCAPVCFDKHFARAA